MHRVLGAIGNEVIALSTLDKKVWIQKWNASGNIELSKKIVPKLLFDNRQILGGFIFNNRIFVQFQKYDRRHDKSIRQIDEYTADSLNFKRTLQIDTVDGRNALASQVEEFARHHTNCEERSKAAFSLQKNYMVDFWTRFEENNSNVDIGKMRVYDRDMNLVWKKEFEFDGESRLNYLEQIFVDDFGNVHLLVQEFFDLRVMFDDGKVNFRYRVMSFMNEGNEFKESRLKLDEWDIKNAVINVSKQGFIAVAGFYYSKDMKLMRGSFSMELDIYSHKVMASHVKEFDQGFVEFANRPNENTLSDSTKKGGLVSPFLGMHMDCFVSLTDGGMLLMAEECDVYENRLLSGDPNQWKRFFFYFRYLVLVKLGTEGEIEWNVRIRMDQGYRMINN